MKPINTFCEQHEKHLATSGTQFEFSYSAMYIDKQAINSLRGCKI